MQTKRRNTYTPFEVDDFESDRNRSEQITGSEKESANNHNEINSHENVRIEVIPQFYSNENEDTQLIISDLESLGMLLHDLYLIDPIYGNDHGKHQHAQTAYTYNSYILSPEAQKKLKLDHKLLSKFTGSNAVPLVLSPDKEVGEYHSVRAFCLLKGFIATAK